MRRVSIDEHLPAGVPAGAVRNLPAVKAVAVALDQIVNRCRSDVDRWGAVQPETLASSEGDLATARRSLDILAAGFEAGSAMVAAMAEQLAPKPPTKPKAK